MSNAPRFLPPKGMDELHLATTEGGHSCVIYKVDPSDGKPGSVIPDRFRKLAVGEGCNIVGLDLNDGDDGDAETKEGLIIAAIAAVMERQLPEEIGGDGRAKIAAVGKQAGFKVTKTQFDAAWPKFVDSLDDDKDDDKDDEV